jgi:hypothetical protein
MKTGRFFKPSKSLTRLTAVSTQKAKLTRQHTKSNKSKKYKLIITQLKVKMHSTYRKNGQKFLQKKNGVLEASKSNGP